MAIWAREIMKLANDFCLNNDTVRGIVNTVDNMTVPQGKNESDWKYDRAHSRLLPLIMEM